MPAKTLPPALFVRLLCASLPLAMAAACTDVGAGLESANAASDSLCGEINLIAQQANRRAACEQVADVGGAAACQFFDECGLCGNLDETSAAICGAPEGLCDSINALSIYRQQVCENTAVSTSSGSVACEFYDECGDEGTCRSPADPLINCNPKLCLWDPTVAAGQPAKSLYQGGKGGTNYRPCNECGYQWCVPYGNGSTYNNNIGEWSSGCTGHHTYKCRDEFGAVDPDQTCNVQGFCELVD